MIDDSMHMYMYMYIFGNLAIIITSNYITVSLLRGKENQRLYVIVTQTLHDLILHDRTPIVCLFSKLEVD